MITITIEGNDANVMAERMFYWIVKQGKSVARITDNPEDHIVGEPDVLIVEVLSACRPTTPLFLECGRCPWNIHGVHDEIVHGG